MERHEDGWMSIADKPPGSSENLGNHNLIQLHGLMLTGWTYFKVTSGHFPPPICQPNLCQNHFPLKAGKEPTPCLLQTGVWGRTFILPCLYTLPSLLLSNVPEDDPARSRCPESPLKANRLLTCVRADSSSSYAPVYLV